MKRSSAIPAAATLVVCLFLPLALASCATENAEAQKAIDSANVHMSKDTDLFNEEAKQTAAWQAAYILAMGPSGMGETAGTVTYLEPLDELIANRLAELEAAQEDLDSVATMNAHPDFKELANLLGEVLDGEKSYCAKKMEWTTAAEELSAAGFAATQDQIDSLDARQDELSELTHSYMAKYEAAAAYAKEHSD